MLMQLHGIGPSMAARRGATARRRASGDDWRAQGLGARRSYGHIDQAAVRFGQAARTI